MMKKVFYKYISVIVIAGLSLSSCNPDLTELNPNSTTTVTFWKNLDDTNQGVTSLYVSLLNTTIFNVREEMVRSDMAYFSNLRPIPNPNVTDQSVTFWSQSFNGDTKAVFQKWDGCYKGIYRANQVIEALIRIQATSDPVRWTQQMAQARFFRGLFHFYLHNSYNNGNVIISDHTPITGDNDDLFKSVSLRDDVRDFFRSDLKYAVDNLPATINAEKGRINQATAATILGTSYLYEGDDNAKAMFYFNLVISNSSYSLENDLTKMFTTAGEFNKESIFEVNYDSSFRPDLGQFDEESTTNRLAFLSISSSIDFIPTAWVTYGYRTEPMDLKDVRNYKNGVVTNNPLDFRGVPLRASAMVILPEDLQSKVYSFPNAVEAVALPGFGLGNQRNLSLYKKWLNTDQTGWRGENSNVYTSQKSSKNFIINRLSDVYLMQAECLIIAGNVSGALSLINKIRARWGLVLYGISGEFTGTRTYDGVDYIANPGLLTQKLRYVDRPLELSAEGCSSRFSDLRRWGILKSRFEELATTTYYTKAFAYTKSTGGAGNLVNGTVVNAPGVGTTALPNEFTIPSANYNASNGKNNYLPIPNNELTRNSNIFK
jgi:hypothetical protein